MPAGLGGRTSRGWRLPRAAAEAAAGTAEAAIEWTHFKTNQDKVLRGAECVVFDRASGLIREIRAFYASPQAEGIARLELGDFDYAGRGYRVTSPRKPA